MWHVDTIPQQITSVRHKSHPADDCRRSVRSIDRTNRDPPSDRPPIDAASGEDPRRVLGRLGEHLTADHLRGLGFAIVERNVRTRHGEIDLIAFDCEIETLIFVEVKTRRAPHRRPLTPEEQPLAWLRPRQRARLRRLAAAWLHATHPARPTAHAIRFDAVGIVVDDRDRLVSLDHLEGAW